MPMASPCCLPIGMTMMNDHAPQEWEIWRARFNFSEEDSISEDDQSAAEETRFIVETPGMVEKLIEAHDESLDDCASADDLDW